MERLMTVRECADALHLCPWAVYRRIKVGSLKVVRIGRTLRIRPEQLQAFIESSSTPYDDPAATASERKDA